jgi:hypothetical protein
MHPKNFIKGNTKNPLKKNLHKFPPKISPKTFSADSIQYSSLSLPSFVTEGRVQRGVEIKSELKGCLF